jgi:hypothetical protein
MGHTMGAQRIKKEVNKKWKWTFQHYRGADTAAGLLLEKKSHHQAALQHDNSQWTGENWLLSPEEIISLDALLLDRLVTILIVNSTIV